MEIYICELSELKGVSAFTDALDGAFVDIECDAEYAAHDYSSIIIKDGRVYGIVL